MGTYNVKSPLALAGCLSRLGDNPSFYLYNHEIDVSIEFPKIKPAPHCFPYKLHACEIRGFFSLSLTHNNHQKKKKKLQNPSFVSADNEFP